MDEAEAWKITTCPPVVARCQTGASSWNDSAMVMPLATERHGLLSDAPFQGLVALTNRWDALSWYPRHNCQGPGMEHLGECHIQCLTPAYSHRVRLRKADSVSFCSTPKSRHRHSSSYSHNQHSPSCLGPPPRPLLNRAPAIVCSTNSYQALSLSGGWACPALQAPGSAIPPFSGRRPPNLC